MTRRLDTRIYPRSPGMQVLCLCLLVKELVSLSWHLGIQPVQMCRENIAAEHDYHKDYSMPCLAGVM